MTGTDTSLADFPMRRPGVAFPPPEYAHFREQPGLVRSRLPTGAAVWLVTRHEDVRTVLTDPRVSSNPDHDGFPSLLGRTGGVPSPDTMPGWFVALDPPEHDRFRKTLIPEFSVRRIRQLRPVVERIVGDRIDAMLAAGGTADLVADFALPVPSLVISGLLGVPEVDRDFFESRTRVLVTTTSTDQQREAATKQLLRYLDRLIAIKRKRPGDDLISRLLAAGTITPAELSGVSMLLLIAGHETTANNIALGVLTLLMHPQWIGDAGVVEELLRLHSVADLVALRVATEDLDVSGQLIRAGEGIVPLVAAANHDEGAFGCPHRFDPGRKARHHVAFGYGVHQCLGQNLVRIEMEAAYQALFDRIPGLRLARPAAELPFKYDGVLFGLHSLPVQW
ncbi:cytochrome P450 [Saccharopolyspora erythraea]|uniref:cytochrome P450 n=1 Tax=Saccharopolyspora erythraea TaxID=1836 RepID=UPI001BAD4ACA|nr:cytochrome P450 [Saccharopolyspora erythraea]QUH01929.1 cytochrome P450 [Saccharopolyspora erythraea]